MATVINNPSGENSSGWGMVIGIILVVLVVLLFFVYGLPALRNNSAAPAQQDDINVDINLPTGGSDTGTSGEAPAGTAPAN
ncbi:hypothetical protein A2738_00380 [Candidatus Nomurabacteria bacterium RIFCSPHIGHO2_01_FULL_42_15]|uniref:Uncharacterized protein n=1 Tax=Candidatus Nomurabacteria bacterium RIFCSPHIGHO2_01_FULL_42_15 TaxID=1801742 RepID=A0A1F6VEF3_9BACT|nr:MAG: hypothetical protein A2738_00380 [Candidatus Nomurabacteria bacterium RIFCSPHIGHO2_01_FULL_42_15]OGI93271.1 MAG: hypothetical protein A3A99_03965 [Candidatus Nomurabacteria bacterium RIFCSPLOWO2_01_FULL_41_18]